MKRREIEKHILMTKEEAMNLQKKAKKVCLSQGALIRTLLKGYEPREKPDEGFYDAMRKISVFENKIDALADQAALMGSLDAEMLKSEAKRWHNFRADIERIYLRHEKSKMKWQ